MVSYSTIKVSVIIVDNLFVYVSAHPAKQKELDYVYKTVPDDVRKTIANAQPSEGPSTDFANAIGFVSNFVKNRTAGDLEDITSSMKKVRWLVSKFKHLKKITITYICIEFPTNYHQTNKISETKPP